MDPIEEGKKRSAYAAVDENLRGNHVIGVGSGSTVVYAVERIAQIVRQEYLQIVCIPTSFQALDLIKSNGLVLTDLISHPSIDVTFDGADEVDDDKTLIKGGGGCMTQEKLVAFFSKKFIIICDRRKISKKLGDQWKKGIPMEVIPMAWQPIKLHIESQFGGEADLRMAKAKCGPVVTDNGNLVLDWIFPSNVDYDWQKINQKLTLIPGVVETGIFHGMVTKVYCKDL